MRKTKAFARILALILIIGVALVPMLAQTVASAASGIDYSKYNLSDSNSKFDVELDIEYFVQLLGGSNPVGDIESDYLKENYSDINVKYCEPSTDKFEITALNDVVTVTAEPYVYTTSSEATVTWYPISATIVGTSTTVSFNKNGDSYVANISGVQIDDSTEVSVKYEIDYDFVIGKGDLNQAFNATYDYAQGLKDIETQYNDNLVKYQEYVKYLEEFALYQKYLEELALYQEQLEKYNAYQKALETYNKKVAAYNEYLEKLEKYNEYNNYQNLYPGLLDQYNLDVVAYRDYCSKMNTINVQLTTFDTGLLENVTTLERQLYSCIMGDTVNSVLKRKEEIVAVVPKAEKAIDDAGYATDILRNILTQYCQLTTEKDKYEYYSANYTAIKDNIILLTQTLYYLYSASDVVKTGVHTGAEGSGGKTDKYIIMVSQLVLFANAISDEPVYSYPGTSDSQILLNKDTTIEYLTGTQLPYKRTTKTVLEILEGNEYVTDSGKATPVSGGYPQYMEEPVAPVHPDDMPAVTKPTIVRKPGNPPAVVEEPTQPVEVKDPGLKEEVKEPEKPEILNDQHTADVIAALDNGTIAKRDTISQDYVFTPTADIQKNVINDENVTVTFYDDDRSTVLSRVIASLGSKVEYRGTTPTKASTETEDYTFIGWKYANGKSVDFNKDKDLIQVSTDISLYSDYKVTSYAIIKFFDTDRTTLLQSIRAKKGSDVAYSGTIPAKSDNDAVYTFDRWVDENGNSYALSSVGDSVNLYPHFIRTAYIYVNFYAEDRTTILHTVKLLPGQSASYTGANPSKESIPEADYSFAGWVDKNDEEQDLSSVSTSLNLYPNFAVTTYVVIDFYDANGNVIDHHRVLPGTPVSFAGVNPMKGTYYNEKYEIDYTFSGWTDKAEKTFEKGTSISSDVPLNLYPTFAETRYVVVDFYDTDGTKLSGNLEYRVRVGSPIVFKGTNPTKASTEEIDFTFSGWVDEYGNAYDLLHPTSSAKLYPAFSETRYVVVKFYDTDNTLLYRARVLPGTSVVYGGNKTPVKESDNDAVYSFDAWVDSNGNTYDLSDADSSIDLYPHFKPTYYIYIRFHSTDNISDSTVIYTVKILPGESAAFVGTDPVKASTATEDYTFNGWKDSTGKVYDLASFASSTDLYPNFAVTTYVVIDFYDANGNVIDHHRVLPGTPTTFMGKNPTKDSIPEADYIFSGWKDSDGNAFDLAGLMNPQTSVNLYPEFEVIPYVIIRFYACEYGTAENSVLIEKRVRPGTAVIYNGNTPEKADEPEFGYIFAGWRTATGAEFDLSAPVTSMDLYPIFSVTDYIILNFYDTNGDFICNRRIPKGKGYVYDGIIPTKAAEGNIEYEFSYWIDENNLAYDFTNPQYSSDLYPKFREIKYVVIKFLNTDGTLLIEKTLRVGETLVFEGDAPAKESIDEADYTFAGWEDSFGTRHTVAPDGDVELYPSFDVTRFVVIKFLDADGEVLEWHRVEPNSIVTFGGNAPVKPNEELKEYTFKGWVYEDGTPVGTVISSDVSHNIYPTFNVVEFVYVNFIDYDGTTLKTYRVRLNGSVSYDGLEPKKPSTELEDYRFSGNWENKDGNPANLSNITGHVDFYPVFDAITYVIVSFYDVDGNIIDRHRVLPGTPVSFAGVNPMKGTDYNEEYEVDYTFSGWTDNADITINKGSQISTQISIDLYPTFTEKCYVVVEFYAGNTVLESYRVQLGTSVTFKGVAPGKESDYDKDYIFSHWVDKDENSYDLANAQYSAKLYPAFEAIKYVVVEFYDTDGTLLSKDGEYRVLPGTSIIFTGIDPKKASTELIDYVFAGWVDETGNVYDLGNPQVNAKLSPYFTENHFAIVRFHDTDGSLISEPKRIPVGSDVVFGGNTPVKNEDYYGVYTFSHWKNSDGVECDLSNISESIDLYPGFSIRPYLDVVFYAFDRVTVLDSKRVLRGASVAYAGDTPIRATDEHGRYSFAYWVDGSGEEYSLDHIDESVELYPEFSLTPYIVITFVGADGETVLDVQKIFPGEGTVVYGGDVPIKDSVPEADYTFSGIWRNVDGDVFDLQDPTESVTVYPDFSITPYNIINFYACDGVTVLESLRQRPDQKIVYSGSTPVKSSTDLAVYEFTGWTYADGTPYNFERLMESADFYPAFREIPYVTVTFYDLDGESVLYSVKILQGESVVYDRELPTKESDTDYAYSFSHWVDASGNKYTFSSDADICVYPVFTSIPYVTVTFYDLDGVTVLDTQRVLKGTEVVFAGILPSRESDIVCDYVFDAWVDENGAEYDLSSVKGNDKLYATLKKVYKEYELITDPQTGLKQYKVDLGDIAFVDIPLAHFIEVAAENRSALTIVASDISVKFAYSQMSAMRRAEVAFISAEFKHVTKSTDGYFISCFKLMDAEGNPLDVLVEATVTVDCMNAEEAELYEISYINDEGEKIAVPNQTLGSLITFDGQNNVQYDFRVKYDVNVSADLPVDIEVSLDSAEPGEIVTITLTETAPPGTILTIYYYDDDSVKHIVEGDSFIMPEGYVFVGVELKEIIYTVTFISDGVVLSQYKYKYGDTVSVPKDPAKQNDGTYSYTFAGWSEEITTVTCDITYEARFDAELLPEEPDEGENKYLKLFNTLIIVLVVILVVCAVFTFIVISKNFVLKI